MKKGFVIGMIALASTLAFSSAHAAATAAKAPREALASYTKDMKDYFVKIGANKGINSQNRATIDKMLEQDLGISGVQKSNLMNSLSGSDAKMAARMDGLASIVAAKKLSVDLATTDKAEADSISAAALASVKMLANSNLVGATKETATLKGDNLILVREGIVKAESLAGDILVKFSKAERDSYTKVLEKYDELASKGSAEEAFVQAIMDVKGVSREKALETVRKLKECV